MPFQHYISNFTLRNFADEQDVLWIMDKHLGRLRSMRGSRDGAKPGPKNQIRYKAFGENRYNPDHVENALCKVESEAAGVIRDILDGARAGKPIILDHRGKFQLCAFLFAQIVRVPRMKQFAMQMGRQNSEAKRVYWEMFSNIGVGSVPTELDRAVADPSVTDHDCQDLILLRRMTLMQLDITKITSANHANFMIGDEPCLMNGFLARPGEIVTMPLAKDVTVQLSRPEDSAGGLHPCGAEFALAKNTETFKKANRFVAGPDPSALRRLHEILGRVD